MSNQTLETGGCDPLGPGHCMFPDRLGSSICNDTGGVLISEPINRCDYYICGFQDLPSPINKTSGPFAEGADYCVDGSYNPNAGFRTRPVGLWSIALVALAVLPSIVTALPTVPSSPGHTANPHSFSRRNISTSSFERTTNVDWSSVEDQLHGKSPGSSTILGRSRYTLLSHEPNPGPDSIGKNILAARQLEGIPAYDTVYQENVDRTGTWDDCPETASFCARSGLSPAGGSISIETSYTRSYSIGFGVDVGAVATFKDVINLNSALSFNFDWAETTSYSQHDTCNFNANVGVVQIFFEPIMGWADTASRTCQVSPIYGELYCTDWQFGHIDYPLENNGITARYTGCSAGEENVHCNDPIGTQHCE